MIYSTNNLYIRTGVAKEQMIRDSYPVFAKHAEFKGGYKEELCDLELKKCETSLHKSSE